MKPAAGAAKSKRRDDRHGQGPVPAAPDSAGGHGGQPHHGTDRKVDPAGLDDRGEPEGENAEFRAQAHDLKPVCNSQKMVSYDREERNFESEERDQNQFPVAGPATEPPWLIHARGGGGMRCRRPRRAG